MMVLGMVMLMRCRGCRPSTATAMLVCKVLQLLCPVLPIQVGWLFLMHISRRCPPRSLVTSRYLSFRLPYQDHSDIISYYAGDRA